MQDNPLTFEEPIVNIAGTSGVTRSVRIFAPTSPPIDNSDPSTHAKGKHIENTQQRQDSLPANEVDEFLCIIRRSDYKVVD